YPCWIARVSWNVAERRQVWYQNVFGTGIREATNQRRRPSCGRGHAGRAIIAEEIIDAPPDNVESAWVHCVGGEIIVHLLPQIIDRDCHIAGRSNDDHLVPRAVFRRRAAKGVVCAAAQAITRHRET